MIDERCVNPRAAGMVDTKVGHLSVSTEQVASFIVNHQFLNQFRLLHHVQMEAGRRFASPKTKKTDLSTSKLILPSNQASATLIEKLRFPQNMTKCTSFPA